MSKQTLREALALIEQAETALRTGLPEYAADDVLWFVSEAATKMRAALDAEPAQPVAWMLTEKKKYGDSVVLRKTRPDNTDMTWWDITPLYATPQPPADVLGAALEAAVEEA